jgi:hypothetical protein
MTLTESQISTLLLALDVAFNRLDERRDGQDYDPNWDALVSDVRSLRNDWEDRSSPRSPRPCPVRPIPEELLEPAF